MRSTVPPPVGEEPGPILPPHVQDVWVEEILRWVEGKRRICRVLLTGSRVREHCRPDSDLDIAVLIDGANLDHDGSGPNGLVRLLELWRSELQAAIGDVTIDLAIVSPESRGCPEPGVPIFTRLSHPALLEATG